MHVRCPHCRTQCIVDEKHRGVPVKCGRCGRSFTTRVEPAASPLHLDVAAAGAAGQFLTQHLVCWNLDGKHELAVLVLASGEQLGKAAAALTPLLSGFLDCARPDAVAAVEKIRAAVSAIIWDGRLTLGGVGGCTIHHHSGGRLTRLRDSVKLSAGDWLILAGDGVHLSLDESALQREITAAAQAEHLAQHGGTILVVRCY